MVVEYIRYKVPADRDGEFESAWSEAQQVLREAPQCERYEVLISILCFYLLRVVVGVDVV